MELKILNIFIKYFFFTSKILEYLYMCEWCEDRDTSLTGHSNGGVDTPRQADVYQGQQVGQQHGEHALLHGHGITSCHCNSIPVIVIFY